MFFRNWAVSISIIAIFLIGGCTEKKVASLPQYPGWKTYSYRHFVFHFPENSYWGRNMDSFSAAYEKYLTENCDFLAIEIPADTIHFYIHDNVEEGKRLTGRDMPFHTENQIHWDRQTSFGLELARYLIDKMEVRRTDFDFLYDGLAALRDYSNENYHHLTSVYQEIGQYIPLDTLIDNQAFHRAHERHRNSQAASLVAFITYNWGINRFKMLWQATGTFEESVKELFGVDLKTFEKGWLQFARQYYEGIKEGETIFIDSTGGK